MIFISSYMKRELHVDVDWHITQILTDRYTSTHIQVHTQLHIYNGGVCNFLNI